MAQTVKLKRTSVAGRIPTTSNIEVGELAFNTNDKALFVRGDSDSIVAIHDESTLHIAHSTNRVGIGTTSPNQPLEVAGRIRATTDPTFEAFESSTKRGGIQWNATSDYLNVFSVGGNIILDSNGNHVGVGPGGMIPNQWASYTDNGATVFQVKDTNDRARIVINGGNGAHLDLVDFAGSTDDKHMNMSVDAGILKFGSLNDAGNAFVQNNIMVMDLGTGKVGIGTTSPAGNLHVVGASGESGIIYISDTDNGTGATDSLLLQKSGNNAFVYNRESAGDLSLGAGNTSNHVIIKSAGNVGIGTTSPDTKLDITANGIQGIILNQDLGNTNVSSRLFFKDGTRTNAILSVNGNLQFRTGATIGSSSGTSRLVVKGNGTITFNEAYTFPASDGSANQVLQTDGSGNLSFATVQAGGGGTVSEAFKTIAVSGQDNVVADAATDTLTLAAGSGMTITTNASSDTVTFAASSTSFTDSDGDTKIQVEESSDEDIIRFDTAGTERMTLSSSVLSVKGTSNPEIELVPNGSVGNADFRFDGSSFDIRSNSSSASLLLSTNSTERMRIDSAGKVGIGTTSPSSALDIKYDQGNLLNLYRPNSSTSAASLLDFSFNTVNATEAVYARIRADVETNTNSGQGGDLSFHTANSGSVAEKMRITQEGNVGIGTSSIDEKLQVEGGNVKIEAGAVSTNRGLIIAHTGQTGNQVILEGYADGSPRGRLHTTQRRLVIEAGSGGGTGTSEKLELWTNANRALTIDTSQRVGIGTASPATKLHVFTAGHFKVDTGASPIVEIANNSATSSTSGTATLKFTQANTQAGGKIVSGRDGDYSNGSTRQTHMAFYTATAASDTEKMRLDSSGNLMLGNTGASAKLDIRHDSGYAIRAENGSGYYFRVEAGGDIETLGSVQLQTDTGQLQLGADNDMQIFHNGANGEINNATGNFTIDSAGDIILDADGADVLFKDGGTQFGSIRKNGNNIQLMASIQDGDITFHGNDGGSAITALTLDMSASGAATFNDQITIGSGSNIVNAGNMTLDVGGDITLDADGGDILLRDGGTRFGSMANFLGNLVITSGASGTSIIIGDNAGNVLMGGNVSINDNKKLKLGNSGDLQIFHDGTNSYIQSTTGNFNLTTDGGNEFALTAVNNGAVSLFHNGTKTFETTAPGIQITGTGDSIPTASNASLYLVDNSTLAANTGGSIVFSGIYTSGGAIVSGGPYIKGYKENATSNDYGFGLKFGVRENGQGATGPVFTLSSTGDASFTDSVTVAGDIIAKDSNSTTDPSITFTGHTDTGFSVNTATNEYLNVIVDGVRRGYFSTAGIESSNNVYTASGSAFRNYGGTWKGTTGVSGNGFQFVNTADSVTAMNLSASGNVVFAGEVEGASLDINGVADISGNLTVGGNLVVNGTTTTLNTATLDVEDKNITLNKGSGDTSSSANGAGITIQDAVDASTDATFTWNNSSDSWNLSHLLNAPRFIQTSSVESSFYAVKATRSGSGTSNPDFYGNNGTLVLGTSSSDERLALTTSGAAVTGNLTASGTIGIDTYTVSDTSTTTSATTEATIDSFTATAFRSCRYTVQVTNNTDSTYHTTELLLVHDGTTPGITEFGTIFTGAAAEATFDADISSGSVRLRATPASTDSMTFKVIRHAITT